MLSQGRDGAIIQLFMKIQLLGLLSPPKANVRFVGCLFVPESNDVVRAMRDGAIVQAVT